MISNELLETKFFIPSSRANLVKRDRLIQNLHHSIKGKLTLISAPAGFGKTTLLAQLLQQTEFPYTWLSLDERDNQPIRFWTYFVAALQKIEPRLGEPTIALLRNSETNFELFLTSLINDIFTHKTDILLILDDYHEITNIAIHQAVTFLLNNLPPTLHLIIASRCDPPLPLARLRARGKLRELRAEQLRFTNQEATLFACQVMQLHLSEEQIGILQIKVEGWIAGLQMAALSLQQCSQISNWIESLQGNQRYIWDYLTEEVLEQQPDYLKSFLLKTSILDRMCGSLCDAVLQLENSTETLEYLDRINLFVIPLDDNRCWYRYHHLFGELLRYYLRKQGTESIAKYHHRAAEWYKQENLTDEAFKHALIIQNWELAIDLIKTEACQLIIDADFTTLLNRLKTLPNNIICLDPWLCIYYAWTLWMTAGDIAGARQYLEDGERASKLKPLPDRQPSWTNHPLASEVDEFWGSIVTLKSYLAHEKDITEAIRLAKKALATVPKYNYWLRSLVLTNLGGSYYFIDEFKQAELILIEAVSVASECKQVNKIKSTLINRTAESAVISLCLRAELKELHGEFPSAITFAQQALEIVTERHWIENASGILTQAVMGKLLWQQNKLEQATHYLTQGKDRSSPLKKSSFTTIRYLYLTLVHQAQGNSTAAWEAIEAAEEIERSRQQGFNFEFPTFLSLDLVKVRLWLAEGNIESALAWQRSKDLAIDDELNYHSEPNYLTLTRILIAQKKWESALYLLQRLQQSTGASQRIARLVEVLILQTTVYQAQNQVKFGLEQLDRIFSLVHPQAYLRLFLDAGESMKELLDYAATQNIYPHYVNWLLTAFDHIAPSDKNQNLIEPLSDRELEILQHIATGLTNQEIGDRLFISLATVKWHTSNIYGKLSVKNRNQAVVKARELEILSTSEGQRF